jgi:type I restriction enzyme S subunit
MREGWRTATLGDCFSRSQERLGTPDGPAPVFSLLKEGAFRPAETVFSGRVAARDLSNYKVVRPGRWAYSTIHIDEGSIARFGDSPLGVISPMYTTLEWREDAPAIPGFLELLLRSPHMLREYRIRAAGSINRRRSLPFERFAAVPVQLPPLEEQRRIVDLIGALDEVITRCDTVSAGAKSLVASLGAEAWEGNPPLAELSSVGTAVTGSTPATRNDAFWNPPEVPFITPGDFRDLLVDTAEREVSAAGAAAGRRIPAGSLAQVCIGSVGKVGVTAHDAITNQQVNALTGLDELDAWFAAVALHATRGQNELAQRAGQTTLPIVKKSSWEAICIPWPSVRSRQEVGHLAREMTALDRAAQAEVAVARITRRALLRDLLGGDHEIPASYDRVLEDA